MPYRKSDRMIITMMIVMIVIIIVVIEFTFLRHMDIGSRIIGMHPFMNTMTTKDIGLMHHVLIQVTQEYVTPHDTTTQIPHRNIMALYAHFNQNS